MLVVRPYFPRGARITYTTIYMYWLLWLYKKLKNKFQKNIHTESREKIPPIFSNVISCKEDTHNHLKDLVECGKIIWYNFNLASTTISIESAFFGFGRKSFSMLGDMPRKLLHLLSIHPEKRSAKKLMHSFIIIQVYSFIWCRLQRIQFHEHNVWIELKTHTIYTDTNIL